ncbi:MAG: GNAT family N-acetyltransferase [Gemmatimonadaceae bacterium]
MISRPTERDIPAIVALNNMFAPEGKTLHRTPQFVEEHLHDYRVIRGENGRILGIVAIDEYSPALAELVGLAVHPSARGRGYGVLLIEEIADLARQRGYEELFATSFSEKIFEACGFAKVTLDHFPEKVLRYTRIDRTEVEMAEKHCFTRVLREERQSAA